MINGAPHKIPQRLLTAGEVGTMLGQSRHWVLEHMERRDSPTPDFVMVRGQAEQPLWLPAALDQWRAYYASRGSTPTHQTNGYSDHKAVNQVGPVTVTWKLSWRNTHDGGTLWWFSTPQGWYVSNDDGRTWDYADVMIRPGDYHYYSVTGTVMPKPSVAAILRSAEQLRRTLERIGR